MFVRVSADATIEIRWAFYTCIPYFVYKCTFIIWTQYYIYMFYVLLWSLLEIAHRAIHFVLTTMRYYVYAYMHMWWVRYLYLWICSFYSERIMRKISEYKHLFFFSCQFCFDSGVHAEVIFRYSQILLLLSAMNDDDADKNSTNRFFFFIFILGEMNDCSNATVKFFIYEAWFQTKIYPFGRNAISVEQSEWEKNTGNIYGIWTILYARKTQVNSTR